MLAKKTSSASQESRDHIFFKNRSHTERPGMEDDCAEKVFSRSEIETVASVSHFFDVEIPVSSMGNRHDTRNERTWIAEELGTTPSV